MAQQLAHRDRVGIDALAADPAGQVLLDRRFEIDLALGDELQDRRGDKGFGDAGGADVGSRGECSAGVDVGVPGRGSVCVSVVPDDGHPAGQLIAGHDLAQHVADVGHVRGASTCSGQ